MKLENHTTTKKVPLLLRKDGLVDYKSHKRLSTYTIYNSYSNIVTMSITLKIILEDV